MIDFKLITKEDFAIILNNFPTNILLSPMKKPSPTFMKYLPNGFRAGSLTRPLLIKVYTEAFADGEELLQSFLLKSATQKMEELGIKKLFEEGKEITESEIPSYILNILDITLEKKLNIPPHLILMLHGITCTDEQRALSQRIFDSHNSIIEESFANGVKEGEKTAEEELTAEQKKTAKLQKSLDSATKKNSDYVSEAKQMTSEKKTLSTKLEKEQTLTETLKKEKEELEKSIDELKQTIEKLLQEKDEQSSKISDLSSALETINSELAALEEELARATAVTLIPVNDIKRICITATDMLYTDNEKNKKALDTAKEIFTNEESVTDAWKLLSKKATDIIEEICSTLLCDKVSAESVDLFTQAESLMLVQCAIHKALLSAVYKVLADMTVDGGVQPQYGMTSEGDEDEF